MSMDDMLKVVATATATSILILIVIHFLYINVFQDSGMLQDIHHLRQKTCKRTQHIQNTRCDPRGTDAVSACRRARFYPPLANSFCPGHVKLSTVDAIGGPLFLFRSSSSYSSPFFSSSRCIFSRSSVSFLRRA